MNKDREVPVRIIIRKKKVHGGSHSGAWKVAFADFMTSMFALFLVLWLVNQSTDIKSAIAGYFQDPLGRADEYGSSILPGQGTQASTVRPLTQPDVLNLRRDRLQKVATKLEQEKGELAAKSAQYQQLAGSLQGQIASGQVEISELRGRMTVKLKDKILFSADFGAPQPGRNGLPVR